MNIGNIRTYLEEMIALTDAELGIIDDSFDDKTPTGPETEKNYKITFGDNSHKALVNSYADLLPVKITIYNPKHQDEQSSFDSIYTKAYAIRDNVIDPKHGIEDFTEITNTNIIPTILDTADKTIKLDIEFEIRNDFSFC